MKKMYLARQVLLSGDDGSIRIDEEALFDNENQAQSFINKLTNREASESSLKLFRNTITEIPVNVSDNWESIVEHIYSIDGRLLKTISAQETPNEITFKGNYKVGDVIKVKCKLECFNSFSVKGTYAVIGECTANEGSNDEHYIIYHINKEGWVVHKHVLEEILENCPEIPKEHSFLRILSNYFLGYQINNKDDVEKLLVGKIKIYDVRLSRD